MTPNSRRSTVVRRMGLSSSLLVGLVTPNETRKPPAFATACAARDRTRQAWGRDPGTGVAGGSPRQRSGALASHSQPVDQGPAFRLARKGLPHGRSRQSSEGPQRSAGPAKRVDGRDRPCVVNALRAKRGPIPSSRGSASTHPHLFQESRETDLCASVTAYTIYLFHRCVGPAPPGGKLRRRAVPLSISTQ